MDYTQKEIEFGKALNSWNRLYGWVDKCNEDGLTKVKLLFLLDKILPLLKENPIYETSGTSDLLSTCNDLQGKEQNEFLQKIQAMLMA
jgi:hypothetical protein